MQILQNEEIYIAWTCRLQILSISNSWIYPANKLKYSTYHIFNFFIFSFLKMSLPKKLNIIPDDIIGGNDQIMLWHFLLQPENQNQRIKSTTTIGISKSILELRRTRSRSICQLFPNLKEEKFSLVP